MMNIKLTLLILLTVNSLSAQYSKSNNSAKSEDGNQEITILQASEIEELSLQLSDLTTLPAGDAIEGDYIGEIKFSPNGEEIWVLNRTTNNITVIDWDSQEIIQNIPVGNVPLGIDFSDDYAVVACFDSNEVYIINTDDYSIETIINVSEGPSVVHISNNGDIAVVGCEVSDVAEVINLNTLANTNTISDFPISLLSFAFITNNTRSIFSLSNFRITPDGLYVANGTSDDGLKFWNLSTGAISATITEAANTSLVELSADGTKLIAFKSGTAGGVFQIDVASQTLNTQIMATGESLIYSFINAPAVNTNGNKVLVPASSTDTVLFDMDAGTFENVDVNISPSWIGTNDTGDTFVTGSFYLNTIDAASGDVLDSMSGFPFSIGDIGANNKIAASSPLRYESILTRSFVNPTNLIIEGVSPTGSELEADVCYFVKFTPNEEKLLSVNNISGTVSIINVEDEVLETIVPLNTYNISSCDITNDSNYAVVAKRQLNQIAVIDLQTNQVVANVPSGGSGPSQVYILPGDQYAYAVNGSGSDRIGVIALDGASSSLESSFIIGNVGVSFTNKGIYSGLKFTEDGQFGLLASSFTDEVEIIDLNAHQVVDAISTPGFPLQVSISSPSTGNEFAGVTLKGPAGKIAILQRSDSNWTLQGIYNCASEPARIEYDDITNSFWITSSQDKKTQQFSLDTFSIINEVSYSPNLPIAVRNSKVSNRQFTLVNTENLNMPSNNKLFVTTEDVTETLELPTISSHNFDITTTGSYAAVGHWGIDQITIFKDILLGTDSFTINLNNPYLVFPNPVENIIHFNTTNISAETNIELKIVDITGKIVFEKTLFNTSSFSIDRPKNVQAGNYIYQLFKDDKMIQSGKLIFK